MIFRRLLIEIDLKFSLWSTGRFILAEISFFKSYKSVIDNWCIENTDKWYNVIIFARTVAHDLFLKTLPFLPCFRGLNLFLSNWQLLENEKQKARTLRTRDIASNISVQTFMLYFANETTIWLHKNDKAGRVFQPGHLIAVLRVRIGNFSEDVKP